MSTTTTTNWKCGQCDSEPEAPMTQWLRQRGYETLTEEARMHWHFDTGTEDAEYWQGVPEEWGQFNGWRYNKLCTACATHQG
jgi:hypothetical protein